MCSRRLSVAPVKPRYRIRAIPTATAGRLRTMSKSPKDLYKLAQLYKVTGSREAGRVCLQRLLDMPSERNNLYYLVSALEEEMEVGKDEIFDHPSLVSLVLVGDGMHLHGLRSVSS